MVSTSMSQGSTEVGAAPARIRLSEAEARTLSVDSLRRCGYDQEEAAIVADHVVDAALCGYEYSGLPKLLVLFNHPRLKAPRRRFRIVHETPVSARIDGGNSNGMIGAYHAARVTISKAKENGFAVVGLHSSWMSGRSAYYTELAAREGLICMLAISSNPSVAPPGAATGVIGTNPVSFAFPTGSAPFVIDVSTSAMAGTELGFKARRNEEIAEGMAIDIDGKPTRDPRRAKWLLPLAGHKGFALAMAMQSMGILAGSQADEQKAFGYLFLAFKPDLLMPIDEYRRDIDTMLAKVRAVRRLPGVERIRLPSENSFAARERLRTSGIEIDREVYDALLAVPVSRLPDPT